MRTLLLASAACLFTAGAALAQTTTTAPAPQGPTTAPVETQGSAAPGKTAPDNSTPSTAIPPSSVTSPSPTTSSNPGPAAPDNTVQSTPPAATTPAPSEAATTAPTHHWKHRSETLPADADAGTYLHIAKQAIAHKDKARAEDALSHAETRLLSRAVPQTDADQTDDAPAIKSIEQARAALTSGDMDTAKSDTDRAMHQMHHHMGPMASNGMAPTQ
jgi:hypothetical protein